MQHSRAGLISASSTSLLRRDDNRLIIQRFMRSARVSAPLLLQSLLYFAFLHLFSFFGMEALLFHFKIDIERAIARLTGMRPSQADLAQSTPCLQGLP